MLIIGPRYNKTNSAQTGGIVVLLENWIQFCDNKDISYSLIDTNKSNYSNVIIAYLSIVFQFIKNSAKTKFVFLHGTQKDYLYIAPIVVLYCKFTHKKFFLRKFAGSFEEYYNRSGMIKKKLLRFVLSNANATFWETKSLTLFGKTMNPSSFWFPNIRNRACYTRQTDMAFTKRFVFLSQVKKEKGVEYLLKSFSQLDSSYHIDIYGPLVGVNADRLDTEHSSYKGSVSPENVCSVLSTYDVLILPTYWKNEGYPGIIIEAFSVGIPVIATTVGGIHEIVKDKYNGLLVPPKDVEALCDAIKYFNESNYKDMARNAFESFKDFDSEIVNNRILKIIQGK